MFRTPVTALAVLLLGGALLAGCGGSSTTTTQSTTTAQSTSTPAATTAPTNSTGTTASTPSGPLIASPQAVEACKHAIQAAPTLTAAAKAKLEGVCDKAAHGDQAAVKKAAREVCEEVINNSPIPGGASKDQALAACKSR
jgi:hypothetical protein